MEKLGDIRDGDKTEGDYKLMGLDENCELHVVRKYERKTPSDLYGSLVTNSGRINRQLMGVDALIVDMGAPDEQDKLFFRMNPLAIYELINGINEHHLVKIVAGPISLIDAIKTDGNRWVRGEPFGSFRLPMVLNYSDANDPAVVALAQLSGMGEKKPSAVVKQYGSLWHALGCDRERVESWAGVTKKGKKQGGVPGVGKTLVERVMLDLMGGMRCDKCDKPAPKERQTDGRLLLVCHDCGTFKSIPDSL